MLSQKQLSDLGEYFQRQIDRHGYVDYAVDGLNLIEAYKAATRVIAAVQARRAADAEYDQVGNHYVRGLIKFDALDMAHLARKRARDIEDAALTEWEKISHVD